MRLWGKRLTAPAVGYSGRLLPPLSCSNSVRYSPRWPCGVIVMGRLYMALFAARPGPGLQWSVTWWRLCSASLPNHQLRLRCRHLFHSQSASLSHEDLMFTLITFLHRTPTRRIDETNEQRHIIMGSYFWFISNTDPVSQNCAHAIMEPCTPRPDRPPSNNLPPARIRSVVAYTLS